MKHAVAGLLVVAFVITCGVMCAQPSKSEPDSVPIEIAASRVGSETSSTIIARGRTVRTPVLMPSTTQPVTEILDQIVNQLPHCLWYAVPDKPGNYEIWDEESFRSEVLPKEVRQKVFKPKNITSEEAHKAVTGLLTPNIGSASFDPRGNQLFVTDLPPTLEMIGRLLDQIDVAYNTKIFRMKYANVEEMAAHLKQMRSPAAPTMIVDRRTKQIVVRDRADIIRQMELLVEILDIETSDTETRSAVPAPAIATPAMR